MPDTQLHPAFLIVRDTLGHAPTRELMQDVLDSMPETDANFIRDFQTTGFDARVWELYLFAWGSRSGHYTVYRPHDRPDFRFSSEDLRTVWIEAVIAAPAPPASLPNIPNDDDPGFVDAIRYRSFHYVPIRLGSPLFSKLQKRYWELEWVQGLPFVLAIADFHDPNPFRDAGHILAHYLYGATEVVLSGPGEPLRKSLEPIGSHNTPPKAPVPTGFFYQPDAENISAVLFSSGGTAPKFSRMGYDRDRHSYLKMLRYGTVYDHDPDAIRPQAFSYVVGDGSHAESWGEGMEVYHNPRARIPLPHRFFPDAAQIHLVPGGFKSEVPTWCLYSSMTVKYVTKSLTS